MGRGRVEVMNSVNDVISHVGASRIGVVANDEPHVDDVYLKPEGLLKRRA